MAVSYNKLWKLLIDKNMKKKELGEAAGISNSLIAKLGKNENVTWAHHGTSRLQWGCFRRPWYL